jgi:hypothetical protein
MSPRGIPSWGPTKMNIFKKGLMAAMVVMFAALMFFLGVVSNNGQGSILTIGAVLLVFMIGYILWPLGRQIALYRDGRFLVGTIDNVIFERNSSLTLTAVGWRSLTQYNGVLKYSRAEEMNSGELKRLSSFLDTKLGLFAIVVADGSQRAVWGLLRADNKAWAPREQRVVG